MRRLLFILLATLFLCAANPAFSVPTYEAIFLGDLGGSYSQVYSGINNSGHIVGVSGNGSGETHAFLYNGTGMVDLNTTQGFNHVARGINDAGYIVGGIGPTGGDSNRAFLYDPITMAMGDLTTDGGFGFAINNSRHVVGSYPTGSVSHAFLFDGSIHDLGTPDGDFSLAYGISDTGYVVGQSSFEAFLYNPALSDPMINIGTTLGSSGSRATNVNDSGAVVGDYHTDGPLSTAFLFEYSTNSVIDLLPTGEFFGGSNAWGINNGGDVVGYSFDLDLNRVGSLWIDGLGYDVNDLITAYIGLEVGMDSTNITFIEAMGINDNGQIAANAFVGDQHYAFLLNPVNPVPEPATILLLGAGLFGMAGLSRKIKKQ